MSNNAAFYFHAVWATVRRSSVARIISKPANNSSEEGRVKRMNVIVFIFILHKLGMICFPV